MDYGPATVNPKHTSIVGVFDSVPLIAVPKDEREATQYCLESAVPLVSGQSYQQYECTEKAI